MSTQTVSALPKSYKTQANGSGSYSEGRWVGVNGTTYGAFEVDFGDDISSINTVELVFRIENQRTITNYVNLYLFASEPTLGDTSGALAESTLQVAASSTVTGRWPAAAVNARSQKLWLMLRPEGAARFAFSSGSFSASVESVLITATPTAPSGTVDGAGNINFSWTASATPRSSRLEYSQDNAVWTDLHETGDSTLLWTPANAGQFPAGTQYWRVSAKNRFGEWGTPSSGRSFTVRYSAVSQVVPVNSPTDGQLNTATDQTFGVMLEASDVVHTPFTIASATLYWRSGETGNFTAVPMTPSGGTASATIPGGTIPNGTFQWYAEATDNTGRTTRTETYTLTALVADVVAVPVRPVNVVENSSGPIVFAWTYASLDGSGQSAADIQYSTDGGSTWTQLRHVPGADTQWEAPAGTLPGGEIAWRVRAYNSAGTEGPWSSAVTFTVLGAPVVTGVQSDGLPFLTVSWQTTGQVSYKVEIDDVVYGPFYGPAARSYKTGFPMSDGAHIVKVAAQNEYGQWSAWAETEAFVAYNPGPSITARASGAGSNIISWSGAVQGPAIVMQPNDQWATVGDFSMVVDALPRDGSLDYEWFYRTGPDAAWQTAVPPFDYMTGGIPPEPKKYWLVVPVDAAVDGYQFRCRVFNSVGELWSHVATVHVSSGGRQATPQRGYWGPDSGYFLVLRDGEIVGKTYETIFIDRAAIGTHTYQVIQVLANGYITRSSAVTATAAVSCPEIGLLAGGSFLRLPMSESANREQQISRSGQVVYSYYSGNAWPTAEIGEQEDLTISGDVAWEHEQAADAAKFEAMLKQPVIYKTPGGAVAVGVLTGFERRDPLYFKSYRFTVRQMDWEDFVDETGQTGV